MGRAEIEGGPDITTTITAAAAAAAPPLAGGLGACGSAATSPAPAVAAPATQAVVPAPKPKPVVLRFHGSGTWNSPPFKVGSMVIVKYRYSDNTSGYGGDNFMLMSRTMVITRTSPMTSLFPVTRPPRVPGHISGGSSKYHLSVTATGPWYFKIITGLNGRSKTVYANAGQAPAPQAPATQAPAAAVPAAPAPQQPGQDGYAGDVSVVKQYLADVSSGDYSDAWAMGGVNIAGTDYNTWVAGYATTTSIRLDSDTDLGNGAVQVSFTATQSDGGSTSYAGTYYVNGAGVITSASITQTG